ncbi:hypothetical protein Plhal304r1_c005g0019791 [Plasmopara halstedii]
MLRTLRGKGRFVHGTPRLDIGNSAVYKIVYNCFVFAGDARVGIGKAHGIAAG